MRARSFELALAFACMPLATTAQVAQADKAQDVAAIHDFQLNEDFLSRVQATVADIDKDPCRLGFMKLLVSVNGDMSISEVAAQYDAQPGVHEMLGKHGLTASNLLLGTAALMSVAAQEDAQTLDYFQAGAANIAFFKAHKEAIQQFSMQLARQRVLMDDGDASSCQVQ